MADIENPNSNAEVVAAPEPSRHAFWAWKERLVTIIRGNPNGADAEDVAVAEPVERSRYCFLWFWGVVACFFAIVAAILLQVHFRPTGLAHAALVLVGVIAFCTATCLGSFIMNLAIGFAQEAEEEARRVIDLLI